MAELLIYNTEHWMDKLSIEEIENYKKLYSNFETKYNARYQRGDIIEIREDGYCTKEHGFNKQVFSVIVVPDKKSTELSELVLPLYEDFIHPDVTPRILKRRKYNVEILISDQIITKNFDTLNITVKKWLK